MNHPRTRAWRRRQRARYIRRREAQRAVPDRLDTFRVWQLHTPDGQPLPIHHRRQVADGEEGLAPDRVVTLSHWWNCELRLGLSKKCTCSWTNPHWPGGKEGMIWRNIRTYSHPRPFHRGTFDKNKVPKSYWEQTREGYYVKKWSQDPCNKPVKNWKLLYLRRNKVWRAQKLGWQYPGEKWGSWQHLEDLVSWDDADRETEVRGA